MRQLVPKASFTAGYGGTTQYLGVVDGAGTWAYSLTFSADSTKVPLPRDAVFRNLTVYTRGTFGAAVTLTLMVEGVASALTVTLPAGDILASVAGPPVAVLAGQDIGYRYEGPLLPSPGQPLAFCVEIQSDALLFGLAAGTGSRAVGQGWLGGAFGNGVFQTYVGGTVPPVSTTYSLCAVPGTLTGLCLRTYSGAPGAGTWTARLLKNGVVQDGTGGTVDTTTVLTGSETVVQQTLAVPGAFGDRFDVLLVRGGIEAPFALANVAVGVAFTPTVEGEFMLCGGSNDVMPNATTGWKWTRSEQLAPLETDHLAPISVAGFETTALIIERSSPIDPGQTVSHTLRRTETNTPLVVTLAAGETAGDVMGVQAYGAGDTISLQAEPSGAAGAGQLHWGVGMRLASVGTVGPPTYTIDERWIRRLRRAPHLAPANTRVFYRRFELDLERGVGLDGMGQGTDPVVELRVSRDGGFTWSEPVLLHAGRIGAYQARAKAERLGQGRDVVFEVVVSDPVAWSLVQAWLDVEPGAH